MKSKNEFDNKDKVIIISVIISIGLITFFVAYSSRASIHGTIKQLRGALVMDSEVINCELISERLIIINGFILGGQINKTIGVQGVRIFDYLLIISINETYNPKIECFKEHEEDVIPKPSLNYSINNNSPTTIEYNITNFQNNRLFYESRIRLPGNCSVIRDFYTGYLDPDETHFAYFNITCPAGTYNASVQTIFVDELTNQHEVIDELIITAEPEPQPQNPA